MALINLITPFPWTRYSKKLMSKIDNPRCAGQFTLEDSEPRGLLLAKGHAGSIDDGNFVYFFWVVDKDDGIIADAKFQVLGQSALIGAAEVACELMIGKNYDQAKRISTDLIDKQVRDKPDESSFPKESYALLNLILEVIETCAEQCQGLPLPGNYIAPPAPTNIDYVEGGYPGWDDLPNNKKIAVIEEVIAQDIRPYIELDAGGVDIKNLSDNRELLIAYKGSCTSCFSSTGATLSYIQHVLKAKVHPEITVIPDLDSLHPHLH